MNRAIAIEAIPNLKWYRAMDAPTARTASVNRIGLQLSISNAMELVSATTSLCAFRGARTTAMAKSKNGRSQTTSSHAPVAAIFVEWAKKTGPWKATRNEV